MFSRLQEVNKKNLRDGDEEDFIKKKKRSRMHYFKRLKF
jgi:hypothetical protein